MSWDTARGEKVKVQTDIRVAERRQDAGAELPGSRVLGGGAGRETLQEDESVGGTRVKFSWRHRQHLHR